MPKPKPLFLPVGQCEVHNLAPELAARSTPARRRQSLRKAVAVKALEFSYFGHVLAKWKFSDGLAVAACKGCHRRFFVAMTIIGERGYLSVGCFDGWADCEHRTRKGVKRGSGGVERGKRGSV